ncbi:MAG: Pyruvate dehydrogenase E1 component subunit beta [Candidatus Anoxychlamydiales bacterium]|nr:Pyruvate dehydrogenase E1 component subunit beta [Candidatus Anoxychlamydiales bacterium]
MRKITFAKAILEATDQIMAIDKSVYLMGLGVPDPKGIFGTTVGLQKKYSEKRVFDMPISENAMTGVCIGSAIRGMRPIITHQRADFFFLAFDQLINNASKWHYMFANQMNVPMVVRLIVGQGWGQGPQHSQSIHSMLAHIPGLKIVMPSNPYDAKGLLVSAVKDNNPVIFIEHRWLHNIEGFVPEDIYEVEIGKAKKISTGNDITIISLSNMTFEAWKAVSSLEKENISVDLIDVRSVKPLDKDMILESVKKTGKVIIVDPDWKTLGFSSEIMALICEEAFSYLKKPPVRITYPDRFVPTSWTLSNFYYPSSKEIEIKALELMDKNSFAAELKKKLEKMRSSQPLDTPDKNFKGPF